MVRKKFLEIVEGSLKFPGICLIKMSGQATKKGILAEKENQSLRSSKIVRFQCTTQFILRISQILPVLHHYYKSK